MRISIATPAPTTSLKGNGVTAQRWSRLLRELGHDVVSCSNLNDNGDDNRNGGDGDGGDGDGNGGHGADLLIALHARRSARSLAQFKRAYPDRPSVLALTGTDLYGDIHDDPDARRSLELATRLVLLQPHGVRQLPPETRGKARVIYQSSEPPPGDHPPREDVFEVCVIGHLRPVKDPLRTAKAARRLPAASRILVTHLGAALSGDQRQDAENEMEENPRYRWLGEKPRHETLQILARSRLLVLTSKLEGGANVVSEAIVASVPVVSSRISGSLGLLGEDYPGYFPVGDTQALADLLQRAEQEEAFLADLRARCDKQRPLFRPQRELQSWKELLAEICPSRSG